MASVKWIKITTDIFDDEKILLIESLPDAYAIITVWFKLLCLAGKQNNSGVFLMGRIPYTDKMLATIFRMKETTVTMALQTFQQFGMVEIVDGVITIPNWNKHQTLDSYEKRKERDRIYQAERRAAQRALVEKSSDTSSDSSADSSPDIAPLEEDIDKDKDIDIYIHTSSEAPPPEPQADYSKIKHLFNEICKSFPEVRKLTDARRQAIKTRLKKYTVDDFRTVFEMAEASSFLKGLDGGWKASFDWLIKESNMVKVLEGNYVDKPKRYGRKELVPAWCADAPLGSLEQEAIQRMMGQNGATVGNNPDLAERAEQLKQRLKG